jgi:hypothetical protein
MKTVPNLHVALGLVNFNPADLVHPEAVRAL